MKRSLLVAILLSLAIVEMCYAQQLTLVKNNKSDYKIVIPTQATPIEQSAAQQLQEYVAKVSGARMIIQKDREKPTAKEVCIGKTNRSRNIAASAAEDGVVIKTENEKIFIAGGARKGVLYAVTTFLEEQLGCKKLTKEIEIIPGKNTIQFSAINYKHNPSFSYRTTHFVDAFNNAYCDWQKLNFPFEGYNEQFVHSFGLLLPSEKYFQPHPEYFALIDNTRKPTQPCLSHPEVYKIMLANLTTLIKQQPQIKYWSVSQNDGYDYCHCPKCEVLYKKEGGYMGALLPFINKIAKNFPDKTISTLAFLFSDEPPKTIKPARNVEIVYCTWNSTREEPLATSNEQRAVHIRKQLKKWSQLTSNIFVWDYTVNFNHALMPYPNWETLKPNLQFFRTNKVSRVFQQGIGDIKGEFSELRTYLLAKLMWDIDVDENKVISDFLKEYYGPAAPYLSQYLELLQKEIKRDNIVLRMDTYPTLNKDSYLSKANRDKYYELFKKAEQVTLNTPYYARVKKERLGLDYATISIDADVPTLSKRNFEKAASTFINDANVEGIKAVNEGRKTPQNFVEEISKVRSTKE